MATMYSATRPLMPLHKEGPRLQSPRYLPAWLRHRSAVRPQCEIAACAPAGKQVRAAQAATMHPPTRPGVPHVKRRRAPAISTLSAVAAAAQTRPCATGMLHGGGEGKGGCRTPELQWELGPASSGQPCAKSLPGGHAGTLRHPQPLAVPPHQGSGAHASAGNRAQVTSMATMYSTTRPLMLVVMLQLRA